MIPQYSQIYEELPEFYFPKEERKDVKAYEEIHKKIEDEKSDKKLST